MSKPVVLRFSDFPASEPWRTALDDVSLLMTASVSEVLSRPELFQNVAGLIPLITHRVDSVVMNALPALKMIANYGAGVDNLDLKEAKARGIWVSNTPGVLSESTADLTFALILAVCRRLIESHAVMAANAFPGWSADYLLGMDVHGKTLGLVGMGQIGQAVARRARSFNMRVIYTQRTPLSLDVEQHLGVRYCPLETLLNTADIVSLHCPLTPETHHLMNQERLAQMKPSSVLINTARGPVVDEAALVESLQSGHLYGAGLDVFDEEPRAHSGLLTLKNVVMAPHIGSATQETRNSMGDLAIQNMLAFLQQRPLLSQV
jgi:glyoxylate reductase